MKRSLHKRTYIKFSLTFLISIICYTINAQTQGPDIVELKNGIAHQGTIIEQRPGQFLKLWQQPSNDTLILQYSEIAVLKSVQQEEKLETPVDELSPIKKFNQNKYSIYFCYSLNGGSWHHHVLGAGMLFS